MVAAGARTKDIEAALGLSRETVCLLKRQAGVAKARLKDQDREARLQALRTMTLAGRSVADCMAALSVSRATVSILRAQAGVKAPVWAGRAASSGTVRGSVPYLHPLYRRAAAVVPRGLAPDARDDLISDLMLMALEGRANDMAAAYRIAVRDRNRIMGTYRERSLDAPMGGTDLRLIDTIDSQREHW